MSRSPPVPHFLFIFLIFFFLALSNYTHIGLSNMQLPLLYNFVLRCRWRILCSLNMSVCDKFIRETWPLLLNSVKMIFKRTTIFVETDRHFTI